ncbi:hypothetical protein [Paenibacillus sp. GCM10027629]|uniref:hypothetical protein n=1 Tax=Paenibacillus sp. GCM10027629 TaxID=3273414 RepID=UPI0036D21022
MESCKLLGISVIEQDGGASFQLIIPNILQKELPYLMTEIKFQTKGNPNALLMSEDSFFVKKLAELVARKNNSYTMGAVRLSAESKIEEIMAQFTPDCSCEIVQLHDEQVDELHLWVKISVQGFFVEERLDHYVIDLTNERIERSESTRIPDLAPMENRDKIPVSSIQKSMEKLTAYATTCAEQYAKEKQAEVQQYLDQEVLRIESYYRNLELEATSGSSRNKSALDELELLAAEKGNLIDQLHKKYEVAVDQVKIEIVACLVLEKRIEKAELRVISPYGHSTLYGDGERGFREARDISEQDGPYTITSDNTTALLFNTYQCKTCRKLRQKKLSTYCKVCDSDICKECAASSAISKHIICTEHAKSCSHCSRTVSTSEFVACESCGIEYCQSCNSNSCKICSKKLCSACHHVSHISKQSLCPDHAHPCECCLNDVSEQEMIRCQSCEQYYCRSCHLNGECYYCGHLEKVQAIPLTVGRILAENKLQASRLEISEKGNMIYLQGKGTLFKSFLLVYNKKSEKVIKRIDYSWFNKRR